MIVYYLAVFGIMLLFGGTVVWGLWWSINGGQLSDFQKGANSIFTDDEPIGRMTDAFPGQLDEAQRAREERDK